MTFNSGPMVTPPEPLTLENITASEILNMIEPQLWAFCEDNDLMDDGTRETIFIVNISEADLSRVGTLTTIDQLLTNLRNARTGQTRTTIMFRGHIEMTTWRDEHQIRNYLRARAAEARDDVEQGYGFVEDIDPDPDEMLDEQGNLQIPE